MKKIIFLLLPFCWIACNQSGENPFELNFSQIPVKVGDNWGYITQDGKFSVNPQFKKAYTFREGRALVRGTDDKYGYIDESGKLVITPQFKYASLFSEGLAAVTRPDQAIEFIDKSGKTAFSLDPSVESVDPFFNGMARIKVNSKYGYINKEGKIAISPQYTQAGMFLDGLASIEVKTDDKTKSGYIDENGKIAIPPQFDMAGDFFDGLARIKIDTLYGFIDKQGKIVIAPQYSEAYDFYQHCAAVEQGNQWGFIDENGKTLINPQFSEVYPFTSSGLSVVESAANSKWGVIDRNGKFVVNPQYDEIDGFYDHAAIVKQQDKYGLIDEQGKVLVNPIYSEMQPYPLGIFDDEVASDYFSVSDLSNILYRDLLPGSARGYSRSTSFSDLQQALPGLTHDNMYSFVPAAPEANTSLSLTSVIVIPAKGFTTGGDSISGDTTHVYHDDLPVTGVVYAYMLQGKAADRAAKIIDLLKDKKPDGLTQEVLNDHALVLHGSAYDLAVYIKDSSVSLAIYLDAASFDDVKRSLAAP